MSKQRYFNQLIIPKLNEILSDLSVEEILGALIKEGYLSDIEIFLKEWRKKNEET